MPLLQAQLLQVRFNHKGNLSDKPGRHEHGFVPNTRKSTLSAWPTRGRLYLCFGEHRWAPVPRFFGPSLKCSRNHGCFLFCPELNHPAQGFTRSGPQTALKGRSLREEALSGCLCGTEGSHGHRHILREACGFSRVAGSIKTRVPKKLDLRGWFVS